MISFHLFFGCCICERCTICMSLPGKIPRQLLGNFYILAFPFICHPPSRCMFFFVPPHPRTLHHFRGTEHVGAPRSPAPTSGGTLSARPVIFHICVLCVSGLEAFGKFGCHASTIPVSDEHVMPVKFVNVDEEVKQQRRGFLSLFSPFS